MYYNILYYHATYYTIIYYNIKYIAYYYDIMRTDKSSAASYSFLLDRAARAIIIDSYYY